MTVLDLRQGDLIRLPEGSMLRIADVHRFSVRAVGLSGKSYAILRRHLSDDGRRGTYMVAPIGRVTNPADPLAMLGVNKGLLLPARAGFAPGLRFRGVFLQRARMSASADVAPTIRPTGRGKRCLADGRGQRKDHAGVTPCRAHPFLSGANRAGTASRGASVGARADRIRALSHGHSRIPLDSSACDLASSEATVALERLKFIGAAA